MMIHLHHYNHYLIIVGMLGEGKTVCKFTALSSIAKRGVTWWKSEWFNYRDGHFVSFYSDLHKSEKAAHRSEFWPPWFP